MTMATCTFFQVVYLITVGFTTAYCLYNFLFSFLLLFVKKEKKHHSISSCKVTVQLPVYNEKNVLEDLYEHIDKLAYPSDLLEIQILDDSTDSTLEISKKWFEIWQRAGKDVRLLHRTDRTGYKAGALAAGMVSAKGEFICIFDADFRPDPDFLTRLIPSFFDAQVGAVQARWTFINAHQNLLTRLQSLQLNIHFAIEQKGRFHFGLPLQFNGTCGIWRKTAIEEAGGWHSDTLTEDLDLSYRAQMLGCKIVYRHDVLVPGELPANLRSLRIQQYRWMKGGAETAKKLLHKVWSAKMNGIQKLSSTLHLMSSSVYLIMFLMSISTLPLAFINDVSASLKVDQTISFIPLILFTLTMLIANIKPDTPTVRQLGEAFKNLLWLPFFVAFHIGFSFHNAKAVVAGWRGIATPFNRTPKTGKGVPPGGTGFKIGSIFGLSTYPELILGILFACSCAFGSENNPFYHFHILCAMGNLSIFVLSLLQTNNIDED